MISLLENGSRQITMRWAYRLADGLGIPVADLISRSPDQEAEEISHLYHAIPVERRHIVRDVLIAFSAEQPGDPEN